MTPSFKFIASTILILIPACQASGGSPVVIPQDRDQILPAIPETELAELLGPVEVLGHDNIVDATAEKFNTITVDEATKNRLLQDDTTRPAFASTYFLFWNSIYYSNCPGKTGSVTVRCSGNGKIRFVVPDTGTSSCVVEGNNPSEAWCPRTNSADVEYFECHGDSEQDTFASAEMTGQMWSCNLNGGVLITGLSVQPTCRNTSGDYVHVANQQVCGNSQLTDLEVAGIACAGSLQSPGGSMPEITTAVTSFPEVYETCNIVYSDFGTEDAANDNNPTEEESSGATTVATWQHVVTTVLGSTTFVFLFDMIGNSMY